MTHNCIKPGCATTYEDNDPDPYYCPSCTTQQKALAAEIDKKLASRPTTRHAPSFEERMAAFPRIPGTNIPMIN